MLSLPPTDTKSITARSKTSHKSRRRCCIPTEILFKIMRKVELDGPILHYNTGNSKENEAAHTLYSCSLVSKQWNVVSTEMLWKRPVLDVFNVKSFVLGILMSLKSDLEAFKILNENVAAIADIVNELGNVSLVIYQVTSLNAADTTDGYKISENIEIGSSPMTLNFGKGIFVRRLDCPSWDLLLALIPLIRKLMPNCSMYHLC